MFTPSTLLRGGVDYVNVDPIQYVPPGLNDADK